MMNRHQYYVEKCLLSLVAGDLDFYAYTELNPRLPVLNLTQSDHVVAWASLWRCLRAPNFAPTLQKRCSFYLLTCFAVVGLHSVADTYALTALSVVGADSLFDQDSPTRFAYKWTATARLLIISLGLATVIALATLVNSYGFKHRAAIDRAATASGARAAATSDPKDAEELTKTARVLELLSREMQSELDQNPIRIGFLPAGVQLLSLLVTLLGFLLYNDLVQLGIISSFVG
jgi:hypothetical protein